MEQVHGHVELVGCFCVSHPPVEAMILREKKTEQTNPPINLMSLTLCCSYRLQFLPGVVGALLTLGTSERGQVGTKLCGILARDN